MKKIRYTWMLVVSMMITLITVAGMVKDSAEHMHGSESSSASLVVASSSRSKSSQMSSSSSDKDLSNLKWDGQEADMVVTVNGNNPDFSHDDLKLDRDHWQTFSNIDRLGRVGVADALISKSGMPTNARQPIDSVTPTGWHNKKDASIPGEYLYNRCHLIGFQLTGENANIKNLMTGTRAFNADYDNHDESMEHYEDLVASYVRSTGRHVRYEVRPVFSGDNLVANGVQMRAQSVEDDQLTFNVFVFNVQPGFEINYLTGFSYKEN